MTQNDDVQLEAANRPVPCKHREIGGFSETVGNDIMKAKTSRGSQIQILSARQWGRSKNCLKEKCSREISGAFRVFWTRIGPGEAAASCFDTICSLTAGRALFGVHRIVRCAVSFPSRAVLQPG